MPESERKARWTLPREAIEAVPDELVLTVADDHPWGFSPKRRVNISREVLEAAYPLIREAVCQEAAKALRAEAREQGRVNRTTGQVIDRAAEFVEAFGKGER